MSLGIDDPVTRDAYKSRHEYFRGLAGQLVEILEEPINVSFYKNLIYKDYFDFILTI